MASVKQQYRQEIEEAISKAKASGSGKRWEHRTAEKPRILTSAALPGASTPLRLA